MEKQNTCSCSTDNSGCGFAILVLFVVAVVFVTIALVHFMVLQYYTEFRHQGIDAFGISGDFFGLTNAFFSALAFAAIIITLYYQREELRDQRRDSAETRGVLQNQQSAMDKQVESLRRQTFENTFFGMLRLHSEVVAAVRAGGNHSAGREAFSHLLASLRDSKAHYKNPTAGTTSSETVSVEQYEAWYRNNESLVGHYFRTLYNLLRYIEDNAMEQKETYARLVRAQLSSHELELLLYNGCCRWGVEKMKPLIEKYTMLKHLRDTKDLKEWRKRYKETAFEKDTRTGENDVRGLEEKVE